MIVMCNLCGWETNNSNLEGIERHERWHEPHVKRASDNVILGKVVWELCQ